jgi:hypothetical protein
MQLKIVIAVETAAALGFQTGRTMKEEKNWVVFAHKHAHLFATAFCSTSRLGAFASTAMGGCAISWLKRHWGNCEGPR